MPAIYALFMCHTSLWFVTSSTLMGLRIKHCTNILEGFSMQLWSGSVCYHLHRMSWMSVVIRITILGIIFCNRRSVSTIMLTIYINWNQYANFFISKLLFIWQPKNDNFVLNGAQEHISRRYIIAASHPEYNHREIEYGMKTGFDHPVDTAQLDLSYRQR